VSEHGVVHSIDQQKLLIHQYTCFCQARATKEQEALSALHHVVALIIPLPTWRHVCERALVNAADVGGGVVHLQAQTKVANLAAAAAAVQTSM
jgi:formylmethanofuran:tetrahydromethanopterin formyltransferase